MLKIHWKICGHNLRYLNNGKNSMFVLSQSSLKKKTDIAEIDVNEHFPGKKSEPLGANGIAAQ